MELPNKGLQEAHTEAENSSEAAVMALLADANPDPLLPGLVSVDPDDLDLLGQVAENLNAKRRARGRPQGSANRRNAEMFEYFEAMGFKAPELRLLEIISADVRELAAALSGPEAKAAHVSFDKAMEVLKLQARVAEALLPFKFAKRQELQVNHNGAVAHVMMAGRLTVPGEGRAKSYSLTGEDAELSNEINGAEIASHAESLIES